MTVLSSQNHSKYIKRQPNGKETADGYRLGEAGEKEELRAIKRARQYKEYDSDD